MTDHEDDPPPPPSTTGENTSGTAATAVYSYVPSNFPIPAPMVCKGNLEANWEFFRQQWEDYEVATALDKQSSKIRLATLRSVMASCSNASVYIIIPQAIRPEIIARSHASHLGIESCLRKARDSVFWPGMNSEIREVILQCSVCAEFQQKNHKEPMQTTKFPDRPWSRVAIDIFTVVIG